MNAWNNLSLKWKQIVLFLIAGLVPLGIVMVMNNISFNEIRDINASNLQTAAEEIADKIDRNLFERYGDVQAFGLNTVLQNRDYWYKSDTPIVTAMNNYVDTYDIYYLTLLVDLNGNVIAINSKDQDGSAIRTQNFYNRNFKGASWFQDVVNKRFYTSQEGNVGGDSDFTGTVIVPLHVNSDVKKSYPGDDGLTLGFAAPVYDAEGRMVAIWHNYAKFSLVEDIFIDAYRNLKKKGLAGAELTLLNNQGEVIIDYDPSYNRGDENHIPHDFNVLFKLNLAEKGVSAAVKSAQKRQSGFEYAEHARKKIVQAAGFAHHKGALGFPGMNWNVLVRTPDEVVNGTIIAIENKLFVIAVISAIVIALFGFVMAKTFTNPIQRLTDGLEKFAAGDLRSMEEMDVRSNDEIGRLSAAFNSLFHSVRTFLKNSTDLLNGVFPKSDDFGLKGEFEDQLRGMLSQARAKHEADAEASKVNAIVENMPSNIMYADMNLELQYMNPASRKTFKQLEQYLPVPTEKMVGQKIDIFHKNPEGVRRLLADPKNLPHQARIQLGPEKLDLLACAIYDQNKQQIGTMVSWEVVTERVATEEKAKELAERDKQQAEELRAKVDDMLQVVNAAAEGDLTKEITVRGTDAIGQMGEGLDKFFANLRRSIGSIGENAQTLTSSSGQLNGVSTGMASNAEETSAQANVVASASEQVSNNVQTVATGSEEMSASIKEIAQNANEAAKVSNSAVKVADRTNVTIKQLGESSAEIGQVIKVITSIAEQTNLLALNATIEAARAGEAGKGFAVVANEVKELANQTAKATEDISNKIEAIQTDTQEAVSAIGDITEVINKINDISSTIASAVEEQTATTNEIGRNVAEAAKGTQEIAQNITGVAKAAESTTQGANDTQNASGELSKLATNLQTLVSQFKC